MDQGGPASHRVVLTEPFPGPLSRATPRTLVLVRLLLLMNFAANVGPEFFGHITVRVQHDVGAPNTDRVA